MNLAELEDSGRIIYETVVGSVAYGTNTPESDIDIKGFYYVPQEEYLGLNPPITPQACQISDEKNDTTYYSLYRAFELLKTANPNMIELLYMPEDCIRSVDNHIMPELFAHRNLFITKSAYHTHAEYARTQIKKAKGKNKKVHNPQPKERPVREDFCRFISLSKLHYGYHIQDVINTNRKLNETETIEEFEAKWGWYEDRDELYPVKEWEEDLMEEGFPFRPELIKDVIHNGKLLDLDECHVASLEYAPNVFRLYHYGPEAKGVFRGDDHLVCESIPKEDEWEKNIGLLIYDKNEYDKAVKSWKSYWDWKNNSNPKRWESQEGGQIDYDVKNMQHCFRLLYSGLNILTEGEPIVRCDGELLQFLKDIRNEKFTYDELMKRLSVIEEQMDDAYAKSDLPSEVDSRKLDTLYRHLMSFEI